MTKKDQNKSNLQSFKSNLDGTPEKGYHGNVESIDISKVLKQLRKVPIEVRVKFQQWIEFIETKGLFAAQKFPGFKDHTLRGDRKGQRSVYLTKKWRAIYKLDKSGEITLILVEEVMPHDY